LFDFQRYAPLDDLQVRAAATGRRLEAYAAVFGQDQEIRDRDGHYFERIASTAFDRTISQRGTNFQVLFNHGRTIHGESSERFSMPYGVAVEVRPDRRGVWTVTEVANTELGDEIIELANAGALRGMSFSGKFVGSRAAGKHESGLPIKERTEIAMIEFGATPFPAYADAAIVAVRSEFRSLSDDEIAFILADDAALRARLGDLLASVLAADPGNSASESPASSDPGHVVALTPSQRRLRDLILTKETAR
jgi:HK97 family phage prohead protease